MLLKENYNIDFQIIPTLDNPITEEQLNKKIRMLRRKHRFAGFAVLKAPEIPSVLIEMGYLSNIEDEKLIRSPSHRRKIAQAIVNAVDKYFATK